MAQLARQADLAGRAPHCRRQQHLFRQQRVPARLPDRNRPARPDQRRPDRAEFRPAPGIVHAAGGPGPVRAARLAVRALRRAPARLPRRHRTDRGRLDGCVRRSAGIRRRDHPHARVRAAGAAGGAIGCRARDGGDADHQLYRSADHRGAQRRGLGYRRQRAVRLCDDGGGDAAAALRAACRPFQPHSRPPRRCRMSAPWPISRSRSPAGTTTAPAR